MEKPKRPSPLTIAAPVVSPQLRVPRFLPIRALQINIRATVIHWLGQESQTRVDADYLPFALRTHTKAFG
jgi:hypothetical protein